MPTKDDTKEVAKVEPKATTEVTMKIDDPNEKDSGDSAGNSTKHPVPHEDADFVDSIEQADDGKDGTKATN